MSIYMEITQDDFALPVAVADSPGELARTCGVPQKIVSYGLYHAKKRHQKYPRFIVVNVEEDDE